MKKLYIIILFIGFSFIGMAQQDKTTRADQTIEGLNIYPNPVDNGKVYITSKNGFHKDVVVVDLLGKEVIKARIVSKELNVSSLKTGVYFLKITEGEATATRKLIIK